MKVFLFSSGSVVDYHWQGTPPAEAEQLQHELTDFDELYSAAVSCTAAGCWNVFLHHLPLAARDDHGRRLSAAYFLTDLNREEAQHLLGLYLGRQRLVYDALTAPNIFQIDNDFTGNEQAAHLAVQQLLACPADEAPTTPPLMKAAWEWLKENGLRNRAGIRAVCSDARADVTYGEADFYLTAQAFTPYTAYKEQPEGSAEKVTALTTGLKDSFKAAQELGRASIRQIKDSSAFKSLKALFENRQSPPDT